MSLSPPSHGSGHESLTPLEFITKETEQITEDVQSQMTYPSLFKLACPL